MTRLDAALIAAFILTGGALLVIVALAFLHIH